MRHWVETLVDSWSERGFILYHGEIAEPGLRPATRLSKALLSAWADDLDGPDAYTWPDGRLPEFPVVALGPMATNGDRARLGFWISPIKTVEGRVLFQVNTPVNVEDAPRAKFWQRPAIGAPRIEDEMNDGSVHMTLPELSSWVSRQVACVRDGELTVKWSRGGPLDNRMAGLRVVLSSTTGAGA